MAAARGAHDGDGLERRRLVREGNAAEHAVDFEESKARWHTVRKWDAGLWHRVKLYDIGRPGWLYHWLNPRDPAKARRRVGHLYWKCLKRYVMASNLLILGTLFLSLGVGCLGLCEEQDRAWALLLIGFLLFAPGAYASIILFKYVCCERDYSWKLLPEPS